jgi:hypothetical protein
MSEPEPSGPALRFRQHLGRDIDSGHSRVGPKMRQRQTGADTYFEKPLSRPIIRDAHGVFAPGMEHRTENNVVRTRKQAVGPDRIVQIHRLALVVLDRIGAKGRRIVSGASWFRTRGLS